MCQGSRPCSRLAPLIAAQNPSGHPDLDGAVRGRSWNRLTVLMQRLDMQLDSFGDLLLHLLAGAADSDAAGKIRHIRAPGITLLLDHHDVLSHASPLPADLLPPILTPAHLWVPHHPACPPP